jgi:hypothetical protein
MGKWNTNQDITKLIYILWKYFSSWVLIVVVWLRITSTWIRIFVDFVFVPKWNSLILYVQHKKFHGVSKLRYSFNTLDKWAVELCNRKWNVDINVFIFSMLFFFKYINLESEQNQLLKFIIMDQCKSVLFYRIWKIKINHLKLFYEHVH